MALKFSKPVGALLVLLAFCLFFFTFEREPLASDDSSYFEFAAGHFDRYHDSNGQRRGLISGIWVAQKLLGYTDLAYYFVPFISGLFLLLLLFLVSKELFSYQIAIATIALFVCEPTFLNNLSLLLPEIPAMVWLFAAIYFFLLATKNTTTPAHRLLLCALSGASFWWAVFTKESVVLLFPGILLGSFILQRKNQSKVIVSTILFFLCAILMEQLSYLLLWGDFFYRYNVITGGHINGAQSVWVQRGLVPTDYTWATLATRYVTFYLESTWNSLGQYTIISASVLLAIFGNLVSKNRSQVWVGLIFLLAFLAISLIYVGTDPIVPLLRTKARYVLPIIPFLCIYIAAGLFEIFRTCLEKVMAKKKVYPSAIFTAALLMFSFFYAAYHAQTLSRLNRNGANGTNVIHHLVRNLSKHGVEVQKINADHRFNRVYKLFDSEMTFSNSTKPELATDNALFITDISWLPSNSDLDWLDLGIVAFRGSFKKIYLAKDKEKSTFSMTTPGLTRTAYSTKDFSNTHFALGSIDASKLKPRDSSSRMSLIVEVLVAANASPSIAIFQNGRPIENIRPDYQSKTYHRFVWEIPSSFSGIYDLSVKTAKEGQIVLRNFDIIGARRNLISTAPSQTTFGI